MAAVVHGRLVYAGGESGAQPAAHAAVEVFAPDTLARAQWPALIAGRHGTGIVLADGQAFVASGSGNRGGGPELTSIEAFAVPGPELPLAGMAHHPVMFDFAVAQEFAEADRTTFTDHRLMATFTPVSGGEPIAVRGFFAGDGDAADSGAESGGIWRLHFTPPDAGEWRWSARLAHGEDIAIDLDPDAGETLPGGRWSGNLAVAENSDGSGGWTGRALGPLHARDGAMRVNGGRRWYKSGSNSPENLLAYTGFDGTWRVGGNARDGEADSGSELHRFAPHVNDWRAGDPQWGAGRGRGLVGAINYLAAVGVNSQYFLTWNVAGDGKDVWPHAEPGDFFRFDISKLAQWNRVFGHMQARGIALHVVLQETENELLMDGGDTGRERRFYLSELAARFAHHNGLIWNLGEENGPVHWRPEGQNTAQRKAMIDWISAIDPYDRPILLHTHSEAVDKDAILTPLLGYPGLDGLSFQVSDPEMVGSETAKWLRLSREAGRPWVISMDEIGPWQDGAVPDANSPDGHDRLLALAMRAHLAAGGQGVEWYFGAHHPHNDLTAEDLRSRDLLWRKAAAIRREWEAQKR
ncbi:DUF5060 domain-containing protein [Erythrobacter sp. JK5]|uniref:DUF5060 domain-containing protein n=1 Tax=Erythrobacter sp. JK5 TaxID=2829500 RepID=UPI0035300B86